MVKHKSLILIMPKKNIFTTAYFKYLFISTISILSFLLWDTYLVYPIKLFVVLLHELSHAFVAIITGGEVIETSIGYDLSGKAISEGGNAFLIASAGYLGSLIFGALFFYSANQQKPGKWIIRSIAAIILISLANSNPNDLFIALSFIVIILTTASSFYLNNSFVSLSLLAVGTISCFYVLFDIKSDILSFENKMNDAAVLANITGINEVWIGMFWLALSIGIIYFSIKMSLLKKKF